MKSKRRKIALILTIFAALACAAVVFIAYWMVEHGNGYDPQLESKTVHIEMSVGDEYDLSEYLSDRNGRFYISGAEDIGEDVFLDGNGALHVRKAGVYNFKIRRDADEKLFREKLEYVVEVELFAHDYEFGDYKPVENYYDLQNSPNGKYILTRNITVERDSPDEAIAFSGIFVNPEGYTVTIADNYALFASINSKSIVRGINITAKGDTFRCDESAENSIVAENLGDAALICDCGVNTNVYNGENFYGLIGNNDGTILRCEFRGTVFDMSGGLYRYGGVAISSGGDIRDCTVYADGYRGRERVASERVNVYYASMNSKIGEPLPSFPGSGNRAFDLSGSHEMDFSQQVSFTAMYSVKGLETYEYTLFPGCVAEIPLQMYENIAESGARITGFTDSEGGMHTADDTWFLPAAESASICVDARYTETRVEGGSDIYAADSVVELPEGVYLSCTLQIRPFSPEHITLKLAEDTQIQFDTFFVRGNFAVYENPEAEITVELGDSEVYEQRADGIYRKDNNKLCRYDGAAVGGTVTVPDGIELMSGDPFGPLELDTLVTNDLAELTVMPDSDWTRQLKTLRADAALNLGGISSYLGNLVALEQIETSPRTDGFYAEDGILYSDDGTCVFVPCSYAAGGTVTLSGNMIAKYALRNNLAQTVVLESVGEVQTSAFVTAHCSEVIVRGAETIVKKQAFFDCEQLISFRAEGQVRMETMAISYCKALESVELNENFLSVAYDAVSDCENFIGYTQAEECETFTLSDGILFTDGNALIPKRWMYEKEVLRIPSGISDVTLSTESVLFTDTALSKIELTADVQSFSAVGVPVEEYILAQDSEYLVVQDGVLFSADGTRLIAYPRERDEIVYDVPDSVIEIADNAFAYNTLVRTVRLGKKTQTIGEYAFRDTDLVEVICGDEPISIGRYAFYSANLMRPDRLKDIAAIGEYAFAESVLENGFTIEGTLTEIGRGAFQNAEIRSVALAEGLVSIGEEAFRGSTLESIVLPDSLLFIGVGAFRETALVRAELGKNLEEVGRMAFYGCDALVEVTAQNAATAYGEECFDETPFLSEGKTAQNGGIYLGTTMFALFGEGERMEVFYGTTTILSLESVNVKYLALPATLKEVPSVEGLPYLEQLRLGVAAQDEEAVTIDVGNQKFRAKANHLYIYFPKYVTFSGELGDEVYICYDGTEEEFAQYASIDNIDDFKDRVYFFSDGNELQTWYFDLQQNMHLRPSKYGMN